MKLSAQELSSYTEQGFLFLPEYFTQAECHVLNRELPSIFSKEGPTRMMENDGVTVRSVYKTHTQNEVMGCIVRHPRILEPAQQIIGSDVYVHQFKINRKAAFKGDIWEWHQDYLFWLKEDGIPSPQLTNAVIFLDEVNEFNGPLLLIPGSQRENVIEVAGKQNLSLDPDTNAAWIADLTANLRYSLDQPTLERLVKKYGIVAPKGPAGSVLFFHPNVAHGSSPNMSPFNRTILLVSYNSVENTPVPMATRRPDFLAGRDFEPLTPLRDDVLMVHR